AIAAASGATASNLAYTINTSGSTGRPKGVMVEHRAVVNYLCHAMHAYRGGAGQTSLVSTPLSFDATVTSILAPLLRDEQVLLFRERADIEASAHALSNRQDLALLKMTPAHLDALRGLLPASALAGRDYALVIGGDTLMANLVQPWREHAPEVRLFNEYGP